MMLGRRKPLAIAGIGVVLIVVVALALTRPGRPGGFSESPTGALNIPRGEPIEALLADGRVLVIGGHGLTPVNGGDYAEIYDPRTGAFSLVDSMMLPDLNADAVVLQDGRVLIAGGEMKVNYGSDDLTAKPNRWSYLFDPRTGQYKRTGSMIRDRADSSATLLRDGRVLIAGGCYQCGGFYHQGFDSAEIYDPKTDAYTATGSMIVGRARHSATLLADGRVLIVGGQREVDAEIYDPSTGEFTSAGAPLSRNIWQEAFGLPDGRVLVLATLAMYASTDGPVAELFDPVTGSFSETGSPLIPRDWPDAAVLQDGRVVLVGGNDASGRLVGSVEVYDPASGKFSSVGSLSQPRECALVAPLQDGRVLLAGGCAEPPFEKNGWYLSRAEILTVG